MRDGYYLADDQRLSATIRATPIVRVQTVTQPDTHIFVDNEDGYHGLRMPLPDIDEEEHGYAQWLSSDGTATMRKIDLEKYAQLALERGDLPDVTSEDEMQVALDNVFFRGIL